MGYTLPMAIKWKEAFYKQGGGIAKIFGESDTSKITKYVATMAEIKPGFLKDKIVVVRSESFESRNEAANWLWKEGGFKQIRNEEHMKELGLQKYEYWYNA
jgi:hypothetical protein